MDVGNDSFIRRNLNDLAVVHNLEEFVESKLFMLGVVVNGGKCAVILLNGRVKCK